MRITLNLATRPYADLGPAMKNLRMGMGALAVVSLGLALGLHAVHNKAEQARAREHSLDGRLNQVTSERQGYMAMMRQPANARLLAQVDTLNQLFDEKSFSWTLAMENLETVLPGGVQVTTLEPLRDKTGQITLHLRVVGPQDLDVDLVRNLEHSKRFLDPRIVGENAEEAGNGPNQRLEAVSATNRFNFDIEAEYNPPTAEERKAAKSEDKKAEDAAEGPEPGSAEAAPEPGRRLTRLPAHAPLFRPGAGRRPSPGQPAPSPRKPNPAIAAPQPQGGAR